MKPKDQGTRAETRIIGAHLVRGIQARRLPEGGLHDEGDVEIIPSRLFRIVGEVRDRERMNDAEALEKAIAKSRTYRTVLFRTQRYKPNGGLYVRRKTRRCVVISEELWFELLHVASGE